ncbi:enoyl-CoA hydratase/isomerase family protein [Sulfuricystis multivorans]|uniref:enoyl-CoA hydratase/isomerase family protein n=1 Tax=Sulfuricystis multivorans TaxID=2211108 RepID=UPI000F838878|nr:enoyl-CoA hydratase-related protein [Sulfuricystis multivorans]
MAADILTARDGAILTVTLFNPDKLNALNTSMWRRLAEVFSVATADAALRCVIVRGAGTAFATGGDLDEMHTLRATVEGALAYHRQVAEALTAIRRCRHPIVAQITGPCVGGGLEIACACDLRIAGESARFGAPINKLGFSMYPDELAGLLELAGEAVVKEMLLEGRLLTAREAYEKGLLTRVVADETLVAETQATVERIAAGAPLVARWHKQWIARLQQGVPLSEDERRASFAFLSSADYGIGMAAFAAKQPPNFTGR